MKILKNILFKFVLCLVLLNTFTLFSQSLVKNTNTMSICGCPGEVWNLSIPYKPWVHFFSATNSKKLMFTNYNFNIPATASITGIQVDIGYSSFSTPSNTVKDSVCSLIVTGTLTGEDKSPSTPYYGDAGHITFGSPGDTWGLSLSVANVNDPAFGFNYKLYSSAAGPEITLDNGAPMTVYYTNASGIHEHQSSSPGLNAFYANKQLRIENINEEKMEVSIYNLAGKELLKTIFENGTKNSVDLSKIESGIYFYKIKTNTGSREAKFIKD